MKYINELKEKLKFDKRMPAIIMWDFLFWLIAASVIFIFGSLVNAKARMLDSSTGGDFAGYMSSASELELSLLTADMQVFVWTFFIGVFLTLVIGLFAYSYTRERIWGYLLNAKTDIKRALKAMALNLILLVSFIFILIVYSLLVLINRWIFTILFLLFILMLMHYVFSVYKIYTKTGRIFHSIGDSFKLDKKVYLLSLPVFVFYNIVIFGLGFFIPQQINTAVWAVLHIVFAAWLRLLIVKKSK